MSRVPPPQLCNPLPHTPLCLHPPAMHAPPPATHAPFTMHAPPLPHMPPVDRMTDACENITFPQLLLRTVKKTKTLSFTVAAGYVELKAMLNELWSQPGVPVLVLSCVPEYNYSRTPCIRIVEELHLSSLNRPWQVKLT